MLDDAKQLLGNAGKFAQSSHDARTYQNYGEDQEGRPIRATPAPPSRDRRPPPTIRRTSRKYEALGLTYEDGAWKRSAKRHEAYNGENDISIYARTAEPTSTTWRCGTAAAETEEFVVGTTCLVGKGVRSKQVIEEDVEVSEDLHGQAAGATAASGRGRRRALVLEQW